MIAQKNQSHSIFDFSKYIKPTAVTTDYTCNICYQNVDNIMTCTTCKKLFCLSCLHSICLNRYQCPFRCSNNFIIQPVQNLPVAYVCPAATCQVYFKKIQQFLAHMETCTKNEDNILKMFVNRKQYKCTEGKHNLQFLVGTFNELNGDYLCKICNNSTLCRSICRKCNQRFCIKCRPVPCSKKGCPIGHSFSLYQAASKSYTCDICGVSAAITGNSVYDDIDCNFGVCLRCWQLLPEQNQTQVLKLADFQFCDKAQYLTNSAQKNMHKLQFVGKNIIETCQVCENKKKCYLKCEQCKTFYCLSCKIFLAKDKNRCLFNHPIKIQKIPNHQIEEKAEQQSIKCDRCNEIFKNQCYLDEECGTCLCQKCASYLSRIQSEKQRNIYKNYCLKNHSLSLYMYGLNMVQCTECKQIKCSKYFCNICTNGQYFCGGCRIFLQNKIDCLSHTPILIQAGQKLNKLCKRQGEAGYICHKCNKVDEYSHMYYCERCQYAVCVDCFNQ